MHIQRRLWLLSLTILIVLGSGVVGFYIFGRIHGENPTILECAYQTVITLATVGNKKPELAEVWYGQLFIIVLVLVGMGVLFVFATTVTAFLIEGEMRSLFRRKKMDKVLAEIKDHFIVCGAGDTGAFVIEELLESDHAVVIVDSHLERIERILAQHSKKFLPYVVGAAADDVVLAKAGLARARGIVVTLPDERDNLFVTVTARQTNPKVKIVARASDSQAELRLTRAGADAVVSPSRIGGMRMASEMVRPQVVSFLDNMLKVRQQALRIEEIRLGPNCRMNGKALRDTGLRQEADLLVLAIRDATGEHFIYNPPPDTVLEQGATLIVLGPVESVHKIRALT